MTYLIVRAPFGNYKKGDPIVDPSTVGALIASEMLANVIPVVQTDALDAFLTALGLLGGAGPVAPAGFILLLGADGAQLLGADGAPLYGVAQ